MKIRHASLAPRRRAITRYCSAKLPPEAAHLSRRAHVSIVESTSETWRGDVYVSKLLLLAVCSGLGSHTPTVVVSMETYRGSGWPASASLYAEKKIRKAEKKTWVINTRTCG